MSKEIDERITKTMSAVFGESIETVNTSASPGTIAAWDSLGHVNLILALEKEFGIQFAQEELEQMVSYKIVRAVVQSHLEKTGA